MAEDRIIRACIDRKRTPKRADERMALQKASLWNPGDAIRIAFMDGDPGVQKRVQETACAWLDYADLNFYFTDDADADIRISFQADPGSWSYLGTDCRSIPVDQPTMNYGWLTPDSDEEEVQRVVLHEFGHALGCIHEHQNPDGGIQWNKPVVYEYYAGPPNFWSKTDVDHNLFETYDEDLLTHTPLDGESIMLYPVDPAFTVDGFSAGQNTKLSDTDKEFIRSVYS